MKKILGLSGLFMMLALVGCASTQVDRIETEEVRDLSGRWNDTDSRLVSEEIISDVLAHPWLAQFSRDQRRKPAVIVGEMRNLSHEHINVNTFINDIERALINSAKVIAVASSGEREEVRSEREEQDLHAREDTRKPMGQEVGADYILKGSINTILDVEGKKQVRFYQIDITLISLADNTKVWVGQKKIKKFVKKGKLRF